MFVYRLTEPIDLFDGLTPLNDWLTRQHPSRTAWALQAVLALTDAAADVGWRGDMRHLPMVGALPTPSRTTPYLAIKQDNNGDTFLISPPKSPTSTTRPSSPRSPHERAAPGHPTRTTAPTSPRSDHQHGIALPPAWTAGRSPFEPRINSDASHQQTDGPDA
jgi:hypothetical protein